MRLYHGSSMAVEHPAPAFNTGFADLGQGFYLTDSHETAIARARSRARVEKIDTGVVSTFEFDGAQIPWLTWGKSPQDISPDALDGTTGFGLQFDASAQGLAAWMNYVKSCRRGLTAVPRFGEPAVVRAWIATEEVEMVCSGFIEAHELAELIDPGQLVVQYCLRAQDALDKLLRFSAAERYL